MRISDWSSDVCSSDLAAAREGVHDRRSCRNTEPRLSCELRRAHRRVSRTRPHARRRRQCCTRQGDRRRSLLFCGFAFKTRGADLSYLWLRSEEHTSELQSLMRIPYAVFCLKKKQKKTKRINS